MVIRFNILVLIYVYCKSPRMLLFVSRKSVMLEYIIVMEIN